MIIKSFTRPNIVVNDRIKSNVVLITKSYIPIDIIAWVDHYLNYCGFDNVTIFDNNTTCCNIAEIFKDNPRVKVYFIPDENKPHNMQQITYNVMVSENAKYDYQFFCDDDEYLWFNKNKWPDINTFLMTIAKKNIAAFAVPMILISYEDGKHPEIRTKSMIEDCLYVKPEYYDGVGTVCKSFIHKSLKDSNPVWLVPHYISNVTFFEDGHSVDFRVSRDWLQNFKYCDCDIKLFHYYYRSLSEWNEKLNRRRIDTKDLYKDNPTIGNADYIKNGYTVYLNPFNKK